MYKFFSFPFRIITLDYSVFIQKLYKRLNILSIPKKRKKKFMQYWKKHQEQTKNKQYESHWGRNENRNSGIIIFNTEKVNWKS